MFLLRRRALGRRARIRLAALSIVSIAGLLAIIGSPNLPANWLQPARQALAQADTLTPTIVSQPTTPPNPTAGLGEPPLRLQSSASLASAITGEQFNFTTTLAATSEQPRAVELRTNIDGQLELLSASGGSCSLGAALSCKLKLQRGQPATIVVTVRVRPSAAAGSRLVYQALAQDDLSNTAASDQVIVTIAAPPTPTTPSAPAPSPIPGQGIPANGGSLPARPTIPASRPARPEQTALPAVNPAAQNATAPAAIALPVVPAAILHSSAGAAAAVTIAESAAPADSWLVSALGVPTPAQALDPAAPEQELIAPAASANMPVQALDPAAPPLAAPEQELTAPAPVARQRQIVLLPNTAAATPIAGLVALLLGLALTIHGLRRVRRAAAQLDRQAAALGRLAALASAEAQRQARTRKEDRAA